MRDDRERWPAPGRNRLPLDLDGAVLSRAPVRRQVLISGPDVIAACTDPVVQWPQVAPSGTYALALRRDSLLLIDGPDVAEGWDAERGRACSDVSDGYRVFDLVGPRALDILRHGAELSLATASGGAGRIVFGLPVLLARGPARDGFRLHVPPAHEEAMLAHLVQAGG